MGNLVGLAIIKDATAYGTKYFNLASARASVWDDVCGYIKDNSFSTTIPNQTLTNC
jgi:hypothetical protein